MQNKLKVMLLAGTVLAAGIAVTLTFADTPTMPTGLTASAISSSQINLSWTAATVATDTIAGYNVFRNGVQIATTTTTSTVYSDIALAASTSFTYAVAARDSAGDLSTQSASASATTMAAPDITAPSIPAGLTASAISSSQINLSWTASTDNVGVTGYKVFRGGTQIATAPTASYSDTGLTASTTNTYTVAAFDAAGNVSSQSAGVSATTLGVTITPPPVPQPHVKPEEISINPNGHITIHGMTVTSAGTGSFTGTIWGITYTVQYNQSNFEFLFKGGDHSATSTGQVQVGDEIGVMGVITHDAPMTIQAKVIRDYSLIKVRPPKHDNENGNDNGNNGNGNGHSEQDIRDMINQLFGKVKDLQGRMGRGEH